MSKVNEYRFAMGHPGAKAQLKDLIARVAAYSEVFVVEIKAVICGVVFVGRVYINEPGDITTEQLSRINGHRNTCFVTESAQGQITYISIRVGG